MSNVVKVPVSSRKEFFVALENAISLIPEDDTHLGLLLVDITNLARINHTQGFQLGDQILSWVHDELISLSKLPDNVFRIGSHCFAFVLPGIQNPAMVALVINKVTSTLNSVLKQKNGGIKVDLNLGMSVSSASEIHAADMLVAAETSLKRVKKEGAHRLAELVVTAEVEPVDTRFEQALASAAQENDFELFYQPKIALASGRVVGAEALLRWNSSEGPVASPEKIVSMIETMGRSYPLTKWIVHQVMRQQKQWQETLGIGIAVNVQAELVSSPDLVSLLQDAAAIWGVDLGNVTVEITENAIIEDKEAGFNNLVKIRDCGINISIDDFGTGYSSLSYFKHIPATELKIDKTFVQSLLVSPQELELIKIMVQIAEKFDMSVVAEGVEDEATLNILRDLGCDYVQGYYFAPPMPVGEFEQWVTERSQALGDVGGD